MGDELVLRITCPSAGRKKLAPTAPGAGGKLKQSSIAFTILRTISDAPDKLTVTSAPVDSSGSSADPVHIIDSFVGPSNDVLSSKKWAMNSMTWTLKENVLGCSAMEVNPILHALMDMGAYPGLHTSTGFQPIASQMEVIGRLCNAGLVEYRESSCSWFMTDIGVQMDHGAGVK